MSFLNKKWTVIFIGIGLIATVCLNSLLLQNNFRQARDQNKLVSRASDIYTLLDQALLSLVNMETSQRGFLLVKSESLLDTFKAGEKHLSSDLISLERLIKEDSTQFKRLQKVKSIIAERKELLSDLIQDEASAEENLLKRRRVLIAGSALMNQVRNVMEEMKDVQKNLVRINSEKSKRSEIIFELTLMFTLIFSIFVILVALGLFYKNSQNLIQQASEKARIGKVRDLVAKGASSVAGVLTAEEYASHVRNFLSENLNVLSPRLFIFRDGELRRLLTDEDEYNSEDPVKNLTRSDSLLKEAVRRKDLWVVEDIPSDFWKIKSALGSAKPTNLAFLPLCFQDKKIGIVEMGTFAEFNDIQKEVIKKCGEVFGVGLNAVIIREELQLLLERTQQQAEELETQQEELKANNEELEQQTRALEAQQESLNAKNSQLEEIQADLEEKAQELASSSKYKSDFLAKMSHELRTPLNGLLILSSLLKENKDKNLTDQQLEFAHSIKSAGEDLLLLINDILDLSKIEAQKMELRPSEFSLESLIKSMQLTFQNQTKVKGIDLEVQMTQASQSITLYTDRLRLEQILRNFLSNAIKFTSEGRVEICTDLDEDENVVVAIKDTGIGIPRKKQDKIFEAFEQADGSVDRRFGGTGLGLSIARELANLLKGSIALVSEEGEGSCFTLTFPQRLEKNTIEDVRERESLVPSPKIAQNLIEDSDHDFTEEVKEALKDVDPDKRTLMIVEDDEVFLKSVKNLADEYNFQPIAVNNGELALAILEDFAPDAILLDIKLPGISGLALLEKIKSSVELRHIPVHMISAMNYQSNALRMGAHGYLTKPVTLEKVRSALERIEGLIVDPVKSILVIEDDETQSFAITKLIEGDDVTPVVAKSGDEALQKIQSQPFDCIVLDLKLPDTSGFDFLDQLNALEISLPPIVIYTGKELTKEEEVHLYKYSESIIIKGARSPERLLDEVNLFLHRVESLMPREKRQILSQLRTQEDNFKGKTVLLVDDDLRNIFALTNALESKDLNVVTARDGLESLEVLQNNSSIDLVLMDIMMPRMNGFEAMQRIRQSKDFRLKNLPIVALTAKAMKEDHEKCIDAGANDYMTKPVNMDHLNTVLKVWLPSKGNFV